ncbi:bifunctional PIG-L family deacetylase/class I SAM-dependent methyltransferase [Nostocoides sp. Soil756]|uniref:bifunctional PIG-L family deacetylase/class I SAM-dependent methyltransferase n=1 Tax=Nostocoides sp. Soil756 TaxID=1736399 RepID=UPI000701B96D|nr:bifunctional PIG-L family deacetylase/class I SAM-dependent methyltransferase [Tetrasphaera sp. Soil756]KRE60820.1 hypothetical protein ASG78_10550 [Tetrasphaera sp. Soil756]
MTDRAPRFHHADPGTPEPLWLADPLWWSAPLVDVGGLRERYDTLLVLAAHPDDETLAAGGFVAAAHRLGLPVRVLVATAGEASHPGARAWAPSQLALVRAAEVEAAVAALAAGAAVEHLGLPDGALASAEDTLADRVAACCGPGTLVVAPWTADGHPDHDALGRAAVTAAVRSGAAVAHYPLWLWHWGGPGDLDRARLHVVEPALPDLAARAAAVACYPSQTAPLGPGPGEAAVVTAPVLRRARRLVEALVAESGVLPVRQARTDADVAPAFDGMFDHGDDPWGFTSSYYERRKRALTTAVLGQERYRLAVEIGCATGVLTRDLAERADQVVAVDPSAAALEVAARDAPAHVRWELGRAPGAVPDGPADLVVLSEVGYFLTPVELLETFARVRAALAPGGEVVLVHWRHPTDGVPLDGPAVHAQAATAFSDLGHRVRYADADVLVDVWGGPASVAAAEGRR